MSVETFVKDAVRTESRDYKMIARRMGSVRGIRLIHSVFGLLTELGEFADPIKRWLFYGKDLDLVNLKEELGDKLWYLAIAFDELGLNFVDVMETVIAKLRVRYPQKFQETLALNRDLSTERATLEKERDQC